VAVLCGIGALMDITRVVKKGAHEKWGDPAGATSQSSGARIQHTHYTLQPWGKESSVKKRKNLQEKTGGKCREEKDIIGNRSSEVSGNPCAQNWGGVKRTFKVKQIR